MRGSAPAARTSSSPGTSTPTSTPFSSTMRVSTNGSARPKQLRADVARLAVRHDAGGRAGLGHRPRLEQRKAEALLERRVVARVDAGAEAEAQLVLAVELARRRREQHRRHDAEVVDDRRPAVANALPPRARMEAVELDDAAAGEDRRHRRERERVHVAERQRRDEAVDVGNDLGQVVQAEVPLAGAQEVAVGEAAAFRPAGRARGVEQRALGVAVDRLAREARRRARRRDAAGAPRGGSSAGRRRPRRRRRAARPPCPAARPPARSRCGRSGTPARSARRSAWIGTMLTPSALSASQWVKNAGRFSSSRPTRWPWP